MSEWAHAWCPNFIPLLAGMMSLETGNLCAFCLCNSSVTSLRETPTEYTLSIQQRFVDEVKTRKWTVWISTSVRGGPWRHWQSFDYKKILKQRLPRLWSWWMFYPPKASLVPFLPLSLDLLRFCHPINCVKSDSSPALQIASPTPHCPVLAGD